MNDSQSKKANSPGCLAALVAYISGPALVISGLALAYVGGWSIVKGTPYFPPDPFIFSEQAVLVRFNDLYYGVEITRRFFDSPVVSWACGVLAVMCITAHFSAQDDDES